MGRQMWINVLVFAATLSICCIVCLASTQLTDDDRICDSNGSCYSKVFVPTHEFQEVREGQQIPSGLHVRVDFPTGRKEAKLPDPGSQMVSDVVVIDNEEICKCNGEDRRGEPSCPCEGPSEHRITFHRDAIPGSPKPKDSTQLLPIVSVSNHELPQTDYELFEAYLANITSPNNIAVQDLVVTLEGLEDLVHELEFGIKLAEGDGLLHVVALLEHKDNEVKKKAAVVVGTALQNNPAAQTAAFRLNLVRRILYTLRIEPDVKVLSRLLYALSSVVRGSNDAIVSLQHNEGLKVLVTLYGETPDNDFRARCAVFITDLLDPNMAVAVKAPSGGGASVMVDQSHADPSMPTHSDDEIMSMWCSHFQVTLLDTTGRLSFDTREKVLRGLLMVKQRYPLACRPQDGLQPWLAKQQEKVKGTEEFAEYYELVKKVTEQYGWRS